MFDLEKSRIDWDQKIGQGALSKVFPYRKNKDDKKWIVKIIHALDDDQFLNYFEQISIGLRVCEDGILPIKGYSIERLEAGESKIYVKVKNMKGTLKQRIAQDLKTQSRMSEDYLVQFFYSLVCSIDYLHSQNIAHGNIKPENILMDENGKFMLTDIGLVKPMSQEGSFEVDEKNLKKLIYKASEVVFPENKLKLKDLMKADIWSLGIVIAELCIQNIDLGNFEFLAFKDREKYFQSELMRLQKEGKLSKKFVNILLGLVEDDAKRRRTIKEVRNMLEDEYIEILCPEEATPNPDNKEEEFEKGLEEAKPHINVFTQSLWTIVKMSLEHKWKNVLVFNKDKDCSISIQNKGATEGQICQFIQDTINSLRENQYHKRLKHFEFILQNCENITDDGVKHFMNIVTLQLKSLNKFTLVFDNCANITDAGVRQAASFVGNNLKQLKALELHFLNCKQLTNKSNKIIKELSNQLTQLNSISVKLE